MAANPMQDIFRADQLDASRAMGLVIDLQAKLLPLILGQDEIIRGALKLLQGCRIFELPVLVTEQYPKGIGLTVEPIYAALEDCEAKTLEKATFSAWAEPRVREAITTIDRPQVIIAGIETHVCVQQTALDLKSRDYDVFVCADAVGSRDRLDHRVALLRMRDAGVFVTTTESVLFELCRRCGTPQFKQMLDVIKDAEPEPF